MPRSDELEIVDDNEPEIFFHLETPCNGTHGKHCAARPVIYIDRRFGKRRNARLQAFVFVVLGDLSRAKPPRIHAGLRGEHSVYKLLRAHFEREYSHAWAMFRSRLSGDILCERGFSHWGACRQNNEVRL